MLETRIRHYEREKIIIPNADHPEYDGFALYLGDYIIKVLEFLYSDEAKDMNYQNLMDHSLYISRGTLNPRLIEKEIRIMMNEQNKIPKPDNGH